MQNKVYCKQILITGATGLVGTHLLARLRHKDVQITTIGKTPIAGYPHIYCSDLRDLTTTAAAQTEFTTIVNLAGINKPSNKLTDTEFLNYHKNIAEKVAMLAAQVSASRLIHVSSVKVFDGYYFPPAGVSLDQAPRARSKYGKSKLAAESMLVEFKKRQFHCNVSILRLPFLTHCSKLGSIIFKSKIMFNSVVFAASATNRRSFMTVDQAAEEIARLIMINLSYSSYHYPKSAKTGSTKDILNMCSPRCGHMYINNKYLKFIAEVGGILVRLAINFHPGLRQKFNGNESYYGRENREF